MTDEFTVAITGGAGFLGATLARAIVEAGVLRVAGHEQRVDRLLLLDLVEPPADLTADARVRPLVGDLTDQLDTMGQPDVIFHLAAAVSAEAEADFHLGMHANLDLDRVTGEPTSSLVEWGSDPAVEAIVTRWPARFRTDRAHALGMTAPRSFDEVIAEHLAGQAGD